MTEQGAGPMWLSRLVWLFLLLILGGVIALTIALGAGAADPQHAGPLRWQSNPGTVWTLSPHGAVNPGLARLPQTVARPPNTLEVTARFSAGSDPIARWQIVLRPIQHLLDMNTAAELIAVDGGGNFQWGADPRRFFFPHLKPVGQFNQLSLSVDAAGQATLRFNHEVAWKGPYPPGLQAVSLTLSATGGWQLDSRLTWAQISLYAPDPPTATNPAQLTQLTVR